ncbi:cob(I)yrinic acid a,c-diamide adenosyltransferase [Thermodesulfobacteriota bacterium]
MKKGLVMIYTWGRGNEPFPALGQLLRALGRGLKVCIIPFGSASTDYGAIFLAGQFKDLIDFHSQGNGARIEASNPSKDSATPSRMWEAAKKAMASGNYRMLVLAGLTEALGHDHLDATEVINFLKTRPPELHVIITGENAPAPLLECADLVTEIKEVK